MKLFILVIACFVGWSTATRGCKAPMVYRQCGSSCPPTCDSRPRPCTLQCVAGCFCPRGTVLHRGRCIRKEYCPRRCNAPMVYNQCGSSCPPTCDSRPRPCTLQCVAGCFCPPRTVLHGGRCIKKEDCPQRCTAPMVYKECGSACPRTCDTGRGACPAVCVKGCFCPSDKVLHKGRCINRDECPRRCKAPMVYNQCGSSCPPTCDSRPRPCTLQCVAGCFCPPRTVLHGGRCIKKKDCPQRCKSPMVFDQCGSACPPTCDPPPQFCTEQCVRGCFCPTGTVLHKGSCIQRNECPKRCNAPMVYNECGSSCPPTCGPRPKGCTQQCVAGCFCPPGTVLHRRRCINRRDCPRDPCRRHKCNRPGTRRCKARFGSRYSCICKSGWAGRFCRRKL